MNQTPYIEDIFQDFYLWAKTNNVDLDHDTEAASNFYSLIISNKAFTKKQANYLIKILSKYKIINDDHDGIKWKNEFRRIDDTKKISVSEEETGILFCFQFPYAFKETFDNEILSMPNSPSLWDPDKRLRKIKFYDHNLLKILEFCEKHGFSLDESFLEIYTQAEEIWQQEDDIVPHCVVEKTSVLLKNAQDSALEYWKNHKTDRLSDDLLLAKSMGHILKIPNVSTSIDKICQSSANNFYIDNIDKFFEIFKLIDTKVCVIIDRNTDVRTWIEHFVASAESNEIPRHFIKVCFRHKAEDPDNINEWLKEQSLGGKIADGQIFLFLHSPNKWFYKDIDSFKIILMNGVIPSTHHTVQTLIQTHPLIMHVGDIKPTIMRDFDIEEL